MNFFDIFSYPGFFYEKQGNAPGVDISVCTDLEVMVAQNSNLPLGVLFTPNGEYGKFNYEGSKYTGVKSNMYSVLPFSFQWEHLNPEYRDRFEKESNDNPYYQWIDSIVKTLQSSNLGQPSFYIEDGNKVTFFYALNSPLNLDAEYKTITAYFSFILEALGYKVENGISTQYRVPGTINRKQSKETAKFWLLLNNEYVLKNISEDLSSIRKINGDDVNAYSIIISRQNKDSIAMQKTLQKTYEQYSLIENVPVGDLLEKLSIMLQLPYGINGMYVTINGVANQNRIYSERKNSVYYLGSKETFRGGPYNIVTCLLKDPLKVIAFFKENYNIASLEDEVVTEEGDAYQYKHYKIIFTKNDGVIYHGEEITGGRKVKTIRTVINQNLKFIGRGPIKRSLSFNSSIEGGEIAFLFEHQGEQKILQAYTSERDFNRSQNKKGLYREGSDQQLRGFFQTLEQDPKSPKIVIVQQSGYYDGFTVIGNRFNKDMKEIKNLTKGHLVRNDLENIKVQTFYSKFIQIWPESIASLMVLQAIALAGMNKREIGTPSVYPALMITGGTGTGKTTTRNLLTSFLGYTHERSKSANGLTPQPLATLGCDPAILFLEEFTNIEKQEIENIMRNIINRDQSQKGSLTGNITYDYKSPLFAIGETIPRADSLINRFVMIRLKDLHKNKDDKEIIYEKINELATYTCLNDIIEYFESLNSKTISEGLKSARKKILPSLNSDRDCDVYSYLYFVNTHFKLVDDNMLIKYIQDNTKEVNAPRKKVTGIGSIFAPLSCLIRDRKCTITYMHEDNETAHEIVINMSQDVYNSFYVTVQDDIRELGLTNLIDLSSGFIKIHVHKDNVMLTSLSTLIRDTFRSYQLGHSNLYTTDIFNAPENNGN